MRSLIGFAAAFLMLNSAQALSHETPSDDDAQKIVEALAAAGCSMEPADMMTHDGGYELMLVTCDDGAYFMEMSGAFEIIKKIKQ